VATDPPLRLHGRPARRLHAHARRLSLATAGAAALVAVALIAGAGQEASGHSYAIAGPLDSISLSAAGGQVAIHAAVEDGCDRSGVVWTPATGRAVNLKDACGNDASYEGLTLAGPTALWWDWDSGNQVYCSDVFVSALAHPAPHGLHVCDGTEGDTYYLFAGDKTVVAVADFSVCDNDCADANGKLLPDGDYGTEVRRLVGGKLVPLLKPVDLRTFLDARDWHVAVIEPKGVLTVYDTGGKKLWSRGQSGAISDGWLVGDALVGQAGTTVRRYSASGLGPARTLRKGGRLAGVSGGLAVYVTPSQVHMLRLSDGRDRVLATVKGLADAQITPAGVSYGAIRKPSYDGIVSFVPLAQVLRKLR